MKTGIVILNYNDWENTVKMIEQIMDYKCLHRIVVVDNCSTDESLEKLQPFASKKIVILESKMNKGYAYGNNIGIKYLAKNTTCELVVVSNPDVLVEESVLKEMITDMKKDETLSFLGPKVLEYGRISKGWKLPSYCCELLATMNFFNRFSFLLQRYDDSHYQERICDVEVIHGCFFIARLKDFKKLKYFDPNTFLYYEENILGYKAKQMKMRIAVDTSLSVQHLGSQSVDKSLKKVKKYKAIKKSMFYYEKTYRKLGHLRMGLLKIFYIFSLGLAYLTFWI